MCNCHFQFIHSKLLTNTVPVANTMYTHVVTVVSKLIVITVNKQLAIQPAMALWTKNLTINLAGGCLVSRARRFCVGILKTSGQLRQGFVGTRHVDYVTNSYYSQLPCTSPCSYYMRLNYNIICNCTVKRLLIASQLLRAINLIGSA